MIILNSASMPRPVPPEASGRWSLVESLCEPTAVTQTQRAWATASQLLERYGVLTRETIQVEGLPGGFSALYPVLRAMEEAGQIRRGYFAAGLGAAQFALPGAVDRLRAVREPGDMPAIALLAAADPANPYGASLKWPQAPSRRPMRSAGAIVILIDGALAAWQGRGERGLMTFLDNVPGRAPSDVARLIAGRLAQEVSTGRRRSVSVQEVDGQPAHESAMATALVEAGFTRNSQGYLRRSG